jgi:carbamoyl-phosphate synthase large subunit
MRSTGEVLGMADSFGLAFYKAQDAAQGRLPTEGTVLLTIADKDKGPTIVEVARRFRDLGFSLTATGGTQAFLAEHGVESERAHKLREKRPHIADAIMNGAIQLVINTPRGKASKTDDSYIRKAAVRCKTPYITTVSAAAAAVKGIAAKHMGDTDIKSLQEYHRRVVAADGRIASGG